AKPSSWLTETLDKASLFPTTSTTAKNERIVSPVLFEVAESYKDEITLISGGRLPTGEDYYISGELTEFTLINQPHLPYLDAPVFAIVGSRLSQCAVQLFSARLLNEKAEKEQPVLFGCVTTNTNWQFIRFENNTLHIDSRYYSNIEQVLGIWHHIIELSI
ncbi:MAG: hypothetical protein AAF740_01745, partial [Bacteroidota bacterium]